MRVLLTGWPSFLHGEATAGDVLSMNRVHSALVRARVPCEVAWSQVFRPDSLDLEQADPVEGGGKVSAQAASWDWLALVTADEVLHDVDRLRPWWSWCLSAQGRVLAAKRAAAALHDSDQLVFDLLRALQIPAST